jgi:hypothetical protein
MPDELLAAMLGCAKQTVGKARRDRNIPPYKKKGKRGVDA